MMLNRRFIILMLVLCLLATLNISSAFGFQRTHRAAMNFRLGYRGLQLHCTKDAEDNAVVASTDSNKALLVKPVRKVSWMSPRGEEGELAREVLAGMVVALATVPTSVAYSTVIGLSPLCGIWSSAIVGLLVAVVGGGPGLIAGAAGVIAVPMSTIVANYGTPYMGAAVILAALFETSFGLLRMGKLAAYVTEPVIAGFLNAFAMFLVKSQIKVFKYGSAWLTGPLMTATVFTAGLCAFLINLMPSFTTKVPASLAGLLLSSFIAIIFNFPLKSLADIAPPMTFAGGASSLPSFIGLPNVPFTIDTLKIILSTSLGVAMISILETLLASRIACDSYRSRSPMYEKDSPNRMIVGLGLGNAASALFGGFGGCGLIPNTLLNGRSGGEGYASSFAYSLFLSLAVVVFAPSIGKIPMAALAGLMLNVAFNTFEWKESLSLFSHARKSLQGVLDLVGMLVTTYMCFKVDMGLGVLTGVAITRALDGVKVVKGFADQVMAKVVPSDTEAASI